MAFGAQNPDDVIGKGDVDHFPAEMAARLKAREAEIYRTGIPMIDEEEFLNGNQGLIWVLSSKMPLRNLNGEIIGLVGSTRDISQRKEAEDALRQALEKEKELGELKSRFISTASHEFRTPLATILATTETLSAYRTQMSDEQIEQRFSKIKEQIDHLGSIIDDVLHLTKLQARRIEFKPFNMSLDALCRSILDDFRSRSDIRHQFIYNCKDPAPIARLDSKLMRQTINNLLTNAVKYSPIDKPITMTLEYTAQSLLLTVHDEGIGIPDADIKHLFEPFHRASNVGATSGTGLGLVITKESVERHGGIITVESQLGQGTTFTIGIPLIAEEKIKNDEDSGH